MTSPTKASTAPRLSDEQQRIIAHRGGHLQVVACAGSGKTETVAQRIASLLADGVAPVGIVAFTFTRATGDVAETVLTGIAKALPAQLGDVLTLDWKMHQPTRDRVRARVKRVLEELPEEVSNEGYAAAVAGVYEWLLRS